MTGSAMSLKLELTKEFLQRQVRKEVATDLIEWDDGFATILCHQQKSGVE